MSWRLSLQSLDLAELSYTELGVMADSLTIHAGPEEFRRASCWLEQTSAELGVPEQQRSRLDVCLNEVLANIYFHGCATALSEPVFLQLTSCWNGCFREATVSVSDAGVNFDPQTDAPNSRQQTLSETEPGGLGLVMLHAFADCLNYCRKDGRNHLSFSVRWPDTQ